jgi:hypothetical protein
MRFLNYTESNTVTSEFNHNSRELHCMQENYKRITLGLTRITLVACELKANYTVAFVLKANYI